MDRQEQQRHYYQLRHSTMLPTSYATNKNLTGFGNNISDVVDYTKQNSYGVSTGDGQFSNNSSGLGMDEFKYGQFNPNKGFNQAYTNQYSDSTREIEGIQLSKSTIIDPKYSADTSTKKGQVYFYPQKYANTNIIKGNTNNAEESFQSSFKNEGSSNDPYQRKQLHNFSLQFSPKKTKKVLEHPATSRQFNNIQRNNLDNYKKVQLDNNSNNTQPQSNFMKFSIHNIPTSTASNIQSPNDSLDHNKKLTKRQFSVGGLNGLMKGTSIVSPSSAPDTNYFSSNLKNKQNTMIFTKDDFAVIKKLGKGKYGDVFLTQHKHSRIICALKVISKQVILNEDDGIKQFIREATIHTFVSNPYIIQMWGIFSDGQNMYMIQEPALDGQLFKYMRQRKQYIQQPEAAGLIKQLCVGVQYLQSQKIIHRDLKPENILLHAGKIKICDFGWAVYNQDSFRETFCGTPLYLSPDVLIGNQYNDKVDNWAIGIITYQMLYGKIPFKITTQSEMQKILNEQIQFPPNVQVSDIAKNFILSLLDRNPDTRMDIEQVLSHPFMTGAN